MLFDESGEKKNILSEPGWLKHCSMIQTVISGLNYIDPVESINQALLQ